MFHTQEFPIMADPAPTPVPVARPLSTNALPAEILSYVAGLEVQVEAAWKRHQVVGAVIIAFAVGVIIGLIL